MPVPNLFTESLTVARASASDYRNASNHSLYLTALFNPPTLTLTMTSSGVNVFRYTALLLGVTYGVYHQSVISATAKINEINREYSHKENLIQKAKAEWKKKNMPKESKTEGGGVITDPNDSRFDLEAYLTVKMADEAK
ncbi:hypothetical protein MMC08_008900 [Hypocenomyce scalaris]|nr:hypothetical protein [Hypocenomyce scalaris]